MEDVYLLLEVLRDLGIASSHPSTTLTVNDLNEFVEKPVTTQEEMQKILNEAPLDDLSNAQQIRKDVAKLLPVIFELGIIADKGPLIT